MPIVAQGNFRLLIEGRIIHNYPVGGFNAQGIMHLADDIVAAAPPFGDWVLFEHPKADAALTEDGMQAIRMMYEILTERGCVAIGLELEPELGAQLQKEVLNGLSIPSMVETDEVAIEAFLARILDDD